MASARKFQKLPLCQTEPDPTGFEVVPLLAKAEPTSDVGSTSVTAYLMRVEQKTKPAQRQLKLERGARIRERSNSANSKTSEEGGENMLQAPDQRLPCSPW